MRIVIGEGSCGIAAGAHKVYEAIEKLGIKPDVTGCIGMCFLEPIVDIYGENGELVRRLVRVTAGDAEKIVTAVKNGELSLLDSITISADDSAFLEKQTRIALRNCGVIDPTDIDAYISRGGYSALGKVLKMTPEQVID